MSCRMSVLETDETGRLNLSSPGKDCLCSPWPMCAGLSALYFSSLYDAEEHHLDYWRMGEGILFEGEQTGTTLYMELAVQNHWVPDNSISSGLLRHCVRVGSIIWVPQRICRDSEGTQEAQIMPRPGGPSHHRPQISDTAPGRPSSPVECLPPLLRPLPLSSWPWAQAWGEQDSPAPPSPQSQKLE